MGQKNDEIVELCEENRTRERRIAEMGAAAQQKTKHLKQTRDLLATVNGQLRTINPRHAYHRLKERTEVSARSSPRNSVSRAHATARLSLRPRGTVVGHGPNPAPSPLAKNEKEAAMFNKIMDKESNYSRKNVKIYQRKFNKYQKEGGELLC